MYDMMFPHKWSTLKKLIWLKASTLAQAIWSTVTGAIATFTTVRSAPLRKLSVSLEPIQSGSGAPSPDNVRPITGHTAVNVWVQPTHDTTADPTVTVTIPTPPGTVYGGTLDVLTGVLTVDRRYTTIGAENVTKVTSSNYANFQISFAASDKPKADQANAVCISSAFKGYSFNDAPASDDNYAFANNSGAIRVKNTANAGLTSNGWKTLMADVQLCYLLATTVTYQLTPQEVQTLVGQNVVFSDANGDVTVEYRSN